jgi:hypothetical protein
MAANVIQKIDLVDINANSLQLIRDKLALGWVIVSITNLQPLYAKLLIQYVIPE